jgi:hypothetical protein
VRFTGARYQQGSLIREERKVGPENKLFVPKQRHVERVPPGYAVREFQNDPRGRYWYVVTALEVRTGGVNARASSRGKKLRGP